MTPTRTSLLTELLPFSISPLARRNPELPRRNPVPSNSRTSSRETLRAFCLEAATTKNKRAIHSLQTQLYCAILLFWGLESHPGTCAHQVHAWLLSCTPARHTWPLVAKSKHTDRKSKNPNVMQSPQESPYIRRRHMTI